MPEEPFAAVLAPAGRCVAGRIGALPGEWERVTSAGECVFDGLREPPADAVPNGSSGIDMVLGGRMHSLLDGRQDSDDRSQHEAG